MYQMILALELNVFEICQDHISILLKEIFHQAAQLKEYSQVKLNLLID